MALDKKIILFDGICNLCNASVQFVIQRDKKDQFRFTALQSEVSQLLLQKHHINSAQIDSMILIEPGVAYYVKSTAALKIAQSFGGLWFAIGILEWIPEKFRDSVYDFIAKNRYRWYGKQDSCMIPTPELKAKFLG